MFGLIQIASILWLAPLALGQAPVVPTTLPVLVAAAGLACCGGVAAQLTPALGQAADGGG